jgi:hypothetical protein
VENFLGSYEILLEDANPGVIPIASNVQVMIDGSLQIAPIQAVWGNGSETYTDTFEFQLDTSTRISTPEPEEVIFAAFAAGLICLKSRCSVAFR